MTPANFFEAAALLCFVGAGITGICAVIVGGRHREQMDEQWEEAERRRVMLSSQYTADIQALDEQVAPEPIEVTVARRKVMQDMGWGR